MGVGGFVLRSPVVLGVWWIGCAIDHAVELGAESDRDSDPDRNQ